ncbi:hypothetical protein HDV00_008805 [Rhizophlyctis rosea]|nr:hypothetical protein HDV00_008805 [Rhizophlyctis rosea]
MLGGRGDDIDGSLADRCKDWEMDSDDNNDAKGLFTDSDREAYMALNGSEDEGSGSDSAGGGSDSAGSESDGTGSDEE